MNQSWPKFWNLLGSWAKDPCDPGKSLVSPWPLSWVSSFSLRCFPAQPVELLCVSWVSLLERPCHLVSEVSQFIPAAITKSRLWTLSTRGNLSLTDLNAGSFEIEEASGTGCLVISVPGWGSYCVLTLQKWWGSLWDLLQGPQSSVVVQSPVESNSVVSS